MNLAKVVWVSRLDKVLFLTSSVPDLSLHALVLNDKSVSMELNADDGFGVQTKLVAWNWASIWDFPTAESPINTTLNT